MIQRLCYPCHLKRRVLFKSAGENIEKQSKFSVCLESYPGRRVVINTSTSSKYSRGRAGEGKREVTGAQVGGNNFSLELSGQLKAHESYPIFLSLSHAIQLRSKRKGRQRHREERKMKTAVLLLLLVLTWSAISFSLLSAAALSRDSMPSTQSKPGNDRLK